MSPYVSNTAYTVNTKSGINVLSNDSPELNDSKNCKLCRKRLHNSHFYNPKNGLLFSVCDICRKRKRDKYWRNKELLQHSTIDTRLSTRSKQYRQRRDATVLSTSKTSESALTSPSSPETFSPSSISQSSKGSLESTLSSGTAYPTSNSCTNEVIGKLIVVPPQITNLIQTYQHDPAYVRSYIGDYYWSLLCMPYTDTSSNVGYHYGLYRQ